MARVLALTRDLLFGSNVQGALGAAGHEVELLGEPQALRDALDAARPDALVLDLTDEQLDASGVVAGLGPLLAGVATLGYYSHVDTLARERAQRAGVELVVPRSRMAREGAALLAGLLDRST